jgi:hypothetical protein
MLFEFLSPFRTFKTSFPSYTFHTRFQKTYTNILFSSRHCPPRSTKKLPISIFQWRESKLFITMKCTLEDMKSGFLPEQAPQPFMIRSKSLECLGFTIYGLTHCACISIDTERNITEI